MEAETLSPGSATTPPRQPPSTPEDMTPAAANTSSDAMSPDWNQPEPEPPHFQIFWDGSQKQHGRLVHDGRYAQGCCEIM